MKAVFRPCLSGIAQKAIASCGPTQEGAKEERKTGGSQSYRKKVTTPSPLFNSCRKWMPREIPALAWGQEIASRSRGLGCGAVVPV